MEQVKELLDVFLNTEKSEAVRKALPKFKEDEQFIKHLKSMLAEKELRQFKPDDFLPVIDILENIVLVDYPVKDVTHYSSMYMGAIDHQRPITYSKILAHLNKVNKIEKAVATQGITKNDSYGQRSTSSSHTDRRLYTFSVPSYLAFVKGILVEDNDNRKQRIDLEDRLALFENHLKNIKESEVDLGKLFEAGYGTVMETLDARYNHLEVNDFEENANQMLGLLKKLDERGFDIYHESSMKMIASWLQNKKLQSMVHMADYLSKEAFMYVTGMHLKKESPKKE